MEGADRVNAETNSQISRKSCLAVLVQRPQAARAKVHTALLSINCDTHPLNVGLELAVCGPLRVTHIVAKLRALTAHFTLCHCNHLAVVRSEIYFTTRCSFAQLAGI